VQDLERHRQAAAAIDYAPTSVLVRDVDMLPFADLAQKRGITAIRSPAEPSLPAVGMSALLGRVLGSAKSAPTPYRPETIRFGLWDLKPSAVCLHSVEPTSLRIPVAALRRGLEQAIAEQCVFHLALDAGAIAAAGDRAIRELGRFLMHADQRRRQTRLAVLSMRAMAAKLSSPTVRTASRSILRMRAA
jgi:hypothetical protein